ncbi:hypothetical protein MFLAVUS_003722 [Mucor flavus]|uniref:Uncharacterized protein n=1 Tax=Mucor flavus TaxID=439312 RepID=A0ABP9YTW9_9FUNG
MQFIFISANAAILDKRSLSVPVQLCKDDIDAVSFQISVVTASYKGFVVSSGYAELLALRKQAQILETQLKKTYTNCCTYTGAVSKEEVDAVISAVNPAIPQATTALSLAKIKKNQLAQVSLSTNIVKSSLANLNVPAVNLYTCLRGAVPSEYFSYLLIINNYIFRLDIAFADAIGAYTATI